MSKVTRVPSALLIGFTLVVAWAGCGETPDNVVGPAVEAHHRPGHAGGGAPPPPPDASGTSVDLSGAYTTSTSQPVEYKQTGRAAEARSADGHPITYAVDGLGTSFDGACDWSDNLDGVGAAALWSEAAAKFSASADRMYFIHVNLKADGEAAAEHRTEGRFIEGDVMWEIKAGTPADLLPSYADRSATGSFLDGGATKELSISGGALRFRKVLCGSGAGCTSLEEWSVACPNSDTFVATVTP